MKHLLITLGLFLSFSIHAASKGIDITVSLSPIGSFHIVVKKIKGKLIKKGSRYTAKKIYVKIKNMKTGMDLRDEHMTKRLSPKKHPKIIVTKISAKGGKGKGMISIKGINKAFKFTYTVAKKMMSAKFKLNLSKFKVKDMNYMSMGAKDIVLVKANIPIK